MKKKKVWGRDGEATHNVSERPGGENSAREHGARENVLVHDMAGSHAHAPKVTCPSLAHSVWWSRLLDIMPRLHPDEKMKISHQPSKLDHFISGFP